MVAIALDEVTKVFPDGVVAVDALTLEIASGEFFVLLGPTGCGKSTVLRLVAGLDEPTSGHIRIDGRVVDNVPAQDRGVGMVFQHFALHPSLTVAENIAQPLRAAHASHDEITERVAEVAERLGLAERLGRSPAALSGGERQRTAMARAMLRDPRVFLLDEPLSNLDAGVRAELRGEIGRVARELRATTIYVTHDQVEAMTMADRVGVLRRGRLQQVGTPHDVYESPETVFVAAFLGTPRINLFQGAVYGQPGGGVVVDLGTQVVAIPADDPLATVLSGHINDRVTVGLRPDSLYPAPIDEPGGLRGRVRLVEHLGHEVLVHVDTDSVPPAPQTIGLDLPDAEHLARLIPRQRRPQPAPATRTEYGFYPSYQAVEPVDSGDLVVRLPAPDAPRVGQSVALTVDVHRMLLFDPAGVRIRLR